jgi:hypothetical protein
LSYHFKNDNRRNKVTVDIKQVTDFYKNHSQIQTAKQFGATNHTIARMLKKFGAPQRTRLEGLKLFSWQTRSHIPQETAGWKGGRVNDGKGYVRIWCPNHPRAVSFSSNPKKRYVYEHILNWEKANGKPIPKGYIVHHLNGIRNDNRPENLAVLPSIHEHKTWTITQILEERIRKLEPTNNINIPSKKIMVNKEGKKTHVDNQGYVRVFAPNHHRSYKGGYALEHIINWENANKQIVPKGKIIHHLNGVRHDNRPENLVMLHSLHEHDTWTIVNLLRERIKKLETEKGGQA